MTILYGYPGRVWAVVYAALDHFTTALGTTSVPSTTLPLADTVLQTALNGIAAINANRLSETWQSELATNQTIESLPIAVDPEDIAYFDNRQTGLSAAASGAAALVPVIPLTGIGASLDRGVPPIPDPGLLEFFAAFTGEPAPAALTLTNLPTYTAAFVEAFNDIAAAISTLEAPYPTYLYDQAYRFGLEGSALGELVAGFPAGFTGITPTQLWNQLFALPCLLIHADLLTGAPNTLAAQQDQLIRYLIATIASNLSTFILSVDRPVAQQILQATIMMGDTLMDIANRALGNFEQWSTIANINNLQPPFIDAEKSAQVATWGNKLLLPNPNGSPAPGFTPNYLINFLGVDLYYGPVNGDMPAWTGDFQLIGGYDNFRVSLGRRMQTTLGTLMYHPNYGCRIPPEVGNVEVGSSAGYLAAFARSCLKSDPRTGSVNSVTAQYGPNFVAAIVASVTPAGFGTTPIEVNEVINAAIRSAG